MILAGIDEAGYGPLLGPLVVGCCAFEVEPDTTSAWEDDSSPKALPCLWKRLRKHVGRNRDRSGRKLHVNDSKLVYSPAAGLKELERSVLAMLATCRSWSGDLSALLQTAAADACKDLPAYPWYQPLGQERFPLEQDPLAVQLLAKGLRAEMDRNGARCLHLSAQLICEQQLNRMFDATRNKGNVLFSVTARHLDYLLRTFGRQDLVIVCDRQGARGHYGPLLRLMFEEWELEILAEAQTRSEYRLHQAGHAVRIIFTEKAEVQCMAVALASMLSKYLREAMMRRFNAYWRQHLPHVSPTAGYYGDGVRFLLDIDVKRRELGITDQQLVRSR